MRVTHDNKTHIKQRNKNKIMQLYRKQDRRVLSEVMWRAGADG